MCMQEDKHKSLFDDFVQADCLSTRKYGGSGLGLAICSNLVRLMGGAIWVESQPDQGSCFHFTARLDPGAGLGISPDKGESPELTRLRVLVADDNATNRKIVTEMLKLWRMNHVAAAGR